MRILSIITKKSVLSITVLGLFLLSFVVLPFFIQSAEGASIARCKNDSAESPKCFEKLILKTFSDRGLPAAFAVAEKIADVDGRFEGYCHSTMHELGKVAYAEFHATGNIGITDQLSDCNYGFYHSFIEEMVTATGGVEEAKAFCEYVGVRLNNKISAISNCYHGIGHGLSSEPTEREDAVKMAAPGLGVCRNISTNQEFRSSCAIGVFNSIELLYANPEYRLSTPENPFSLCNNAVYNYDEKRACYIEMSVLAEDLSGDNFEKALSFALAVPSEYRAYAVQYTTLYGYAKSTLTDPVTLVTVCRKNAPEYINACVVGTAQGMLVYGKPGSRYESAVAFYQAGRLMSDEKQLFLQTILTSDVYSPREQEEVCAKFPVDLRLTPPCAPVSK